MKEGSVKYYISLLILDGPVCKCQCTDYWLCDLGQGT